MSDYNHRVDIHMTGPGRGTVKLDGRDLKVSEFSIDAGMDQATDVTLRLVHCEVHMITTEAEHEASNSNEN